jgi:hypothetical protein
MKRSSVDTVPQKKPVATKGDNIRRYQRHFCKERPLVSLVLNPEGPPVRAVVRDVSREGVGLILLQKVEPGSLSKIQFQWSQGGPCWIFAAEVKHAVQQPDGSWLLGFHTSRAFSDDELSALRLHFPLYQSAVPDSRC